MLESAAVHELLQRHHRRLYVYLRALLPGDDAEAALRATAERALRQGERAPPDRLAEWADEIARQVAVERRTVMTPLPFSDDLFRQLADSAGPILDLWEKRPATLKVILHQLPPPERDLLRRRHELGLTPEQIAHADGRPTPTVVRDLTALHESLVLALRETLPDAGPEPPGGAADIGRLSDQLLDGTITEDGRLILETLLLADAAAQAHYHRHAALAADLKWTYGGPPPLPDEKLMPPRPGLTAREWTITIAFVAALLAVAAVVVWRVAGYR